MAAMQQGRRFILADHSKDAFTVMRKRFAGVAGVKFHTADGAVTLSDDAL